MLPILTPAEMAAVDATNAERLDDLIASAAGAVARAALRRLGGAYGRRVTVIVGPGNNGADGRFAAEILRRRGVIVEVFDTGAMPEALPRADLVIDAAFGTGLSRPWMPPDPGRSARTSVLAVDIPSGLSGLTGERIGSPWAADETITFAALKPGLLIADGPDLCGTVTVADIGLDVGESSRWLITDDDVAELVPRPPRSGHKWLTAIRVIAGAPGMTGAGYLCAAAAQRTGSGMVVTSTPGGSEERPIEAVGRDLPARGWAAEALTDIERFKAVAIGPGLGRGAATVAEIRDFLVRCPIPCVVDADALAAIDADVMRERSAPTVITPHDGEFARLRGRPARSDRFADVADAACELGAVVLLKGPTTIVGAPDGQLRAVVSGDARLATAGTGDVLTGATAALLARGLEPLAAASIGAHVHGRAAGRLPAEGVIASDVVDQLGPVLADLAATSPNPAPPPARRATTWIV